MIRELISTIRPKQWYKNLVVFVAIFFSGNIFNLPMLEQVIIGFVSLCIISSASYILNDIVDAKADRCHDKKKLRPIASGALSVPVAAVFAILLYISGFVLGSFVSTEFLLAGSLLVILTMSYTFYFKNIAFADIALLSSNFMVRAVAGAIAISVSISPWLLLGTYLMALFLSTSKRKADLDSLMNKAKDYKKVFEIYTSELLNTFLLMAGISLFITYCLYSFLGIAVHSLYLMATIPIVFFLIFRYYYFATTKSDIARNPERVFTDKQMVVGMLLWFIIFFISIYIL
ncbi:decaprenyl-phosphate phosphoribosyltransferase [Candidatus Micrarchaeota archaeon]|nr:decaprenyl-phosphate phosphoribosyltransferase [Candidatus Micrarchaeota archaeon]MBU1165849.1 decaprenyl-phosphate phosphoribosyltransferase [Candidatus Micrarchaeota archaeon]MBU1887011.1 decaprenyl-phosphate phosphoribosyltransferase [Candidatus Micrarchaeota archaeon]